MGTSTNTRRRYSYRGAVKDPFGTVLSWDWRAETLAESAEAAARNFAWQYKKAARLAPRTRVILCAKPRSE